MYFAHTKELEKFRLNVRRFLDQRLPHAQLPVLLERREVSTDFWLPMATQLGLQGTTIPEAHGGDGFGMIELSLVLEETGRALLPEPFFATMLGITALGLAEDPDASAALLPEVVAGRRVLAVGLTDDDRAPACARQTDDGQWRLSGTKVRVIAGQLADTLIICATADSGLRLFAVESAAAQIEPLQPFDIARPQATITCDDTPAVAIGAPGHGEAILESLELAGALMLAAEQVGGAARCLEMATAYAKEREQFGRQIGSFQAIKHQCADMLVRYEAARTAVMYAAWAWDDDAEDRVLAVRAAKAAASDAYWDNTRACIQIHGGIGFTQAHPAQLHFKRATVSAQLFGAASTHRGLIGTQLAESMAVIA